MVPYKNKLFYVFIFSLRDDKIKTLGSVPEWPNGLAWKASMREIVSEVRILSLPILLIIIMSEKFAPQPKESEEFEQISSPESEN